jgi:tripeptide aminopeptidase
MIRDLNFPLGAMGVAAARFLKYVLIDTQSDPNSKSFPSTEKQKDLSRLLVQELLDLGVTDAHLD